MARMTRVRLRPELPLPLMMSGTNKARMTSGDLGLEEPHASRSASHGEGAASQRPRHLELKPICRYGSSSALAAAVSDVSVASS
jgi:hypothetical protein